MWPAAPARTHWGISVKLMKSLRSAVLKASTPALIPSLASPMIVFLMAVSSSRRTLSASS